MWSQSVKPPCGLHVPQTLRRAARQAAYPQLIQQETDQSSSRQRVKANMSASITAKLDVYMSWT